MNKSTHKLLIQVMQIAIENHKIAQKMQTSIFTQLLLFQFRFL